MFTRAEVSANKHGNPTNSSSFPKRNHNFPGVNKQFGVEIRNISQESNACVQCGVCAVEVLQKEKMV